MAKIYGFSSEDDLRRIARSVRKSESGQSGDPPQRRAGGGTGDVYRVLFGKTDSSHAKSASGTVSIWSGTTSTLSDTGDNVTAYNRFADLDSGKWVAVVEVPWGYELIAGECT